MACTYIRYRDTPIGDFYFYYALAPRKETLSLTAMMLEATGGYAEVSEADYEAGLKAERDRRRREQERLMAERFGPRRKPASPETGADPDA